MRCAVFNCGNNNAANKELSFYSFPQDEALVTQWVNFCRRTDSFNVKFARICSAHFASNTVERNLKFEMGFCKRNTCKLKPGSVPTLDKQSDTVSIIHQCPSKDDLAQNTEILAKPLDTQNVHNMFYIETKAGLITKDISHELDVNEPIVKIEPEDIIMGDSSQEMNVNKTVKIDPESIILDENIPATNTNNINIKMEPEITIMENNGQQIGFNQICIKTEHEIVTKSEPELIIMDYNSEEMDTNKTMIYIEPNIVTESHNQVMNTCEGNMNLHYSLVQQIKNLKKEAQTLRRDNLALKKAQSAQTRELQALKHRLLRAEYEKNNIEGRLRQIFTGGQVKKLKYGPKRLIWSDADIEQSFKLYQASAKAYKLLQDKHFPLPSVRTLQNWAKKRNVSLP